MRFGPNAPKSKLAKWAEIPLCTDFWAIFGQKPHFDPIFAHFLGNFDILADFGQVYGLRHQVYGLRNFLGVRVSVRVFSKCTGCAILQVYGLA